MKVANQVLERLKVEKHPDKTFVGRVLRGFDFMGYHFTLRAKKGLRVAAKTIENHLARIARLYEQGADIERTGNYTRRWLSWVNAGLAREPVINHYSCGIVSLKHSNDRCYFSSKSKRSSPARSGRPHRSSWRAVIGVTFVDSNHFHFHLHSYHLSAVPLTSSNSSHVLCLSPFSSFIMPLLNHNFRTFSRTVPFFYYPVLYPILLVVLTPMGHISSFGPSALRRCEYELPVILLYDRIELSMRLLPFS
jgi:hypothetical protein